MPIAPNNVKNESGETIGLDRDGNIVTGDANPEMVTLLAVPGGMIGQDIVDKHNLADRLKTKSGEQTEGLQKTAEGPKTIPAGAHEVPGINKDKAPEPAVKQVPEFKAPEPSEEGPAPRFTDPPASPKGKGHLLK